MIMIMINDHTRSFILAVFPKEHFQSKMILVLKRTLKMKKDSYFHNQSYENDRDKV